MSYPQNPYEPQPGNPPPGGYPAYPPQGNPPYGAPPPMSGPPMSGPPSSGPPMSSPPWGQPMSGPPGDPYGTGYPPPGYAPPDQGYAAQPPGYPPPGYPPQGYQAPPTAPAPAKGGLPPAALILLVVGAVAVVGLSVVIAIGALSKSDKPTPPQTASTAAASEAPSPSRASARPSATRPSGPPATEIPDRGFTGDILLVNKDIAPGTYKADNAKRGCYWARLSGTTGDFDEILDNHFSDNDGPVTVTIQPSDRAFKTNSCGTFKKVS